MPRLKWQSRCHPESPMWILQDGNWLYIECSVCGKEAARIIMASPASINGKAIDKANAS